LVERYWLRVEGNAFLRFQLSTLNFQLSTVSTRRAQPNRYPDFGLKPPSRLPVPHCGTVALGICSRYSGATVPDFHRVPRHLTAMTDEQRSSFSKNSLYLRRINFLPRKKSLRRELKGRFDPATIPVAAGILPAVSGGIPAARATKPNPHHDLASTSDDPAGPACRQAGVRVIRQPATAAATGTVPGTSLQFRACAPPNAST